MRKLHVLAMTVLVLLVLVAATVTLVALANPANHSLSRADFENLLDSAQAVASLQVADVESVSFDATRFSLLERLHLQMRSAVTRAVGSQPSLHASTTDRYVLSNAEVSLTLLAYFVGKDVCLVVILSGPESLETAGSLSEAFSGVRVLVEPQ